MAITKTEAIVYLAYMTSKSDGQFSNYEITSVMDAMPRFYMAVKMVRSNNTYLRKEKSGELSEVSAIETLARMPERDRLEALGVCWLVANADGEIKPGEQYYLEMLTEKLGIDDFGRVIRRAERLSRSNVMWVVAGVLFLVIAVYWAFRMLPIYYS